MLTPDDQSSSDSHEDSSLFIRVGPLVRATGPHSVVIWLELASSCVVTLEVTPLLPETSAKTSSQEKSPKSTSDPTKSRVRSVSVGGRHYATPHLEQLQPATWYSYRISISKDNRQIDTASSHLQCFRTMDVPLSTNDRALRVAYGSCRRYATPRTDALSALGRWLRDHWEQRETVWPHLLLLIGDQIYADQPADEVVQLYPQLHDGATTFEDFALLYNYTWTVDPDVRQALAVLPTYLIFDDHEITNNWNLFPQWRASKLANGQEQLIVDGTVAYWVYQGWGNLAYQQEPQHPLLRIMREGEQHGKDVIEQLRDEIRREVHGECSGQWSYQIPVEPPIFVVDARSERTSLFNTDEGDTYAPTRILSKQQMSRLQEWMNQHDDTMSILVSSVPIILPPFIGFVEYISGVRLLQRGMPFLRWIGQRVARLQQRLAIRMSFDHWPAYSETWREFVQLLSKRRHDIVTLSGDVHFSYAIEARASRHARLLQFVSTPLENKLSPRDKLLIVRQSLITKLWYGGLFMRMLAMTQADTHKSIPRGMLFQNVLAYLTFKRQGTNEYTVQQDYFTVVNGELQVVGSTKIPTR